MKTCFVGALRSSHKRPRVIIVPRVEDSSCVEDPPVLPTYYPETSLSGASVSAGRQDSDKKRDRQDPAASNCKLLTGSQGLLTCVSHR